MLNINQNFDLKAPVFNFDRDYFNSVEELNAYDTSNIPNHFVTNVAGMLYQFTDGAWLPMIGAEYEDETQHYVNLGCRNAYLEIDTQNDAPYDLRLSKKSGESVLSPTELYINSNNSGGSVSIEADYDGTCAGITVSGDSGSDTIVTNSQIICGDDSFKVDIYGDEGRIEINDARGRSTNYSASGFSGRNKDNTESYSLSLPSKNSDTLSFSLKSDSGDFIFDASNGLNINYSNGYDIFTDMGDGSINITSTSEGFNYSSTIYPGKISIYNSDADQLFVISCLDSTEGAIISGIKSLTAFANPSATKVWATDGSTVDLTTKANVADLATKANTSDVLLKKSASGGYYIESNDHQIGWLAFAANSVCTASGNYSFAEGYGKATSSVAHAEGEYATASGYASHAEGSYTVASGTCAHAEGDHTQADQPGAHAEGYYTLAKSTASHAEGYYTKAVGNYSHSEGNNTKASGYCSHAQGIYNVDNKNAIHSVGIGNNTTRKNAEYIYAKNNENGYGLTDDPKNGYKYLIGVGGYDGISTDNTTYKSVQEVIADLTARIEQLETKVRALEAANTPA